MAGRWNEGRAGRVAPEDDAAPERDAGTLWPRGGVPDRIAVHVLLLLCALAFIGRNYEAWGWPSVDGYPAIERALDPDFLTNDFYVESTRGYGVDTFQATLLAAVERTTGIRYEVTLAALNLLRCLAFPWIFFAFANALLRDRRAALLAVVFGSLANYALPKTPGWAWLWGDASPAMFAVCTILLGWTALLQRRVWLAGIFFALTSWIHPLMAVHGGIFAALIVFADYRWEEVRAALRRPVDLAGGALFAASFLTQFAWLSLGQVERISTALYVEIVAHDRHPTDFLPSLFAAETWWSAAWVLLAAGGILWQLRAHFPRYALMLAGLATYLAVAIAGYWWVEVWPLRPVVQLMPYRLVIIAAPLLLCVLATFAAREWRQGQVLSVALFGIAAYAVSPDGWRLPVSGPVLPCFGIALWVALRFAVERSRAATWGRVAHPAAALLVLFAMAAGLVHAAGTSAQRRSWAFAIPSAENQHPIFTWIQDETDPTSVFLVEQHASDGRYSRSINPQNVRLLGRRAVLASKDFPFLDRDMETWQKSWRLALGTGAYDYVEDCDATALAAIQAELPFDYVLRRRPIEGGEGRFEVVAEFEEVAGIERLLVYGASRP